MLTIYSLPPVNTLQTTYTSNGLCLQIHSSISSEYSSEGKLNVDSASPHVPTPVLPGLYPFTAFLLCSALFIYFCSIFVTLTKNIDCQELTSIFW